jgi:AP-1-like factor
VQKRKAQNRAAQRAFRERKEKHLKDLETKVDELEKASQTANQENGLLRAQVERLQVELKEYRKRISWLSGGNGLSTMAAMSNMNSRNLSNLNNNDFYFDFPKFGDLPGKHMFSNGGQNKQKPNTPSTTAVSPTAQVSDHSRNSLNSKNLSKAAKANALTNGQSTYQSQMSASSAASNTDSPSASSESQHGQSSSIGTSPEPSLNSPNVGKMGDNSFDFYGNEAGYGTIDGEKSFCAKLGMACGNINNPMPAALNKNNDNPQSLGQLQPAAADQSLSFDWLAQQNGGSFDPVLFNDYREPQDAILSQDFGAFFNDAFPLPDLDSPFGNPNDVTSPKDSAGAAKKDSTAQASQKQDDDDEVVPGEDKAQIMSCTNIWYVLFRNGSQLQPADSIVGIVFNLWRSSATAKSTSTRCVRSCVPKHAVQKAAWSSIGRMSMTLSDVQATKCRLTSRSVTENFVDSVLFPSSFCVFGSFTSFVDWSLYISFPLHVERMHRKWRNGMVWRKDIGSGVDHLMVVTSTFFLHFLLSAFWY